MKKNLLFGVLTLLSLSVNAQNQKISFENSEGFSIGNLNNQKNWFNWGYVSDNNSKIINTLASDGTNSAQVINNDIEEGNWGGIAYPITKYNKYSISADVYLENANNSDYEMLALYNENNDYDLVGGLLFYYDGEIAYEDMNSSVTLGTWTPKKWYNVKAEVDLKAKKVIYFLDNVKVKDTNISNLNNEITEVNFSFDNYGSGFIVDNINIIDLENLRLDEYNNTEISIFPNPTTDYININSSEKNNTIKITDLTGKVILNEVNTTKINIMHLTKGIYIINIKTDNSESIQKFIKN
ncbi:T9SS type A sorting domain-containing protein [Empedobacter tilapiae]|uniref:T9SS type A sorting domain-containing protein n=1 Tax=Empedobacter tilapiae TaxID=2491114 RepID=A0A4Z1BWT8_9FLAO|nr:T9SS type A sorting domain-containing protein [Empedobacter tilapiae]TGN29409.1 T9SS type A sorting domain-containing protein [Empedobacter tilapiae]